MGEMVFSATPSQVEVSISACSGSHAASATLEDKEWGWSTPKIRFRSCTHCYMRVIASASRLCPFHVKDLPYFFGQLDSTIDWRKA